MGCQVFVVGEIEVFVLVYCEVGSVYVGVCYDYVVVEYEGFEVVDVDDFLSLNREDYFQYLVEYGCVV